MAFYFFFLSNSKLITGKEKKQMSEEVYAYLCDTHKCEKCSFPECSHTTDERHRCISKETTKMRLVGSTNDINYYMEFVAIEGRSHEN